MLNYTQFVNTEEQCSSKDLYKVFKFDEDVLHKDSETVCVFAEYYILQQLKDKTYCLLTNNGFEVNVDKHYLLQKLYEIYKLDN